MDFLHTALTLVKTVQQVLAAMKGEMKLIVTCRQLLHSTQLYSECLTAILQVSADNAKASISPTLNASLARISKMVESDISLLTNIKSEIEEISKTTSTKGFIQNVLISKWTGRIDKVHRLEEELMNRFQIITAIMMKEVYKNGQGLDEATMAIIDDVDGSVFWNSNFGHNKTISFKLFAEAYQDYLSKALCFRKVPVKFLQGLLRVSLVDSEENPQEIVQVEITVNMFGKWLKRFGPMRNTLSKASVLYLPSSEEAVFWFQKTANRDQAVALIERNAQKFQTNIQPHHLVILRYSSDPKNHFVITCRHASSRQIEHFPVQNSCRGYSIAGDEENSAANLIELIQKTIVDRLYLKGNGDYVFPVDTLLEWDAIVSQLTVPLPEGHYGDRKALEQATAQVSTESNEVSHASYGYTTLFVTAGSATVQVENEKVVASTPGIVGTTSDLLQTSFERKLIAKYLLSEAIKLLQESGDEMNVSSIQEVLNRI